MFPPHPRALSLTLRNARQTSLLRAMSTFTTSAGSLTTPDGHELYTKTWVPSAHLKARLVFVHGFSDHCNAYDPLFPSLAQRGIAVHSFDQRGWGRSVHSPAEKGKTGPTEAVMSDITTFTQSVLTAAKTADTVPLFLMGHSMGGAEVLVYAATGPTQVVSQIRGFLVESPFIALHPDSRPWKATVILGRLAGKLLPHMHMVNKLDPKKLSRDPEVNRTFEDDPLCHDTGTLEGLAGMLDRANALESGSVTVREGLGGGGKTRLWVSQGTADGVCDYRACRKWYDALEVEDREMKVYEGWFHRLHAEPGEDKVRFTDDLAKWVLDRCEAEQGEGEMDSKAKL